MPKLRTLPISWKALFLLTVFSPVAAPQSSQEFQQILERLDRLEKENRRLAEEVRSLRTELAAQGEAAPEVPLDTPVDKAPLEERVAVQERRIEEQAQAKVEASQRHPIKLTGMALFNTFLNSRYNGDAENPTTASREAGPATGGAYLRQSVIGLEFNGPRTLWGGAVHGSFYMDFFAGSGTPLNQSLRIRTASIDIDWGNTSVMAGQEKPIISPREPNSLAQVGVSPLTNAGNLWLWYPQVRVEQNFELGEQSNVRAQVGIFQTSERSSLVPPEFADTLARSRPALQGRIEFARSLDDQRRLEIAPGFHTSSSHVAATSVASNLVSVDWFANPWRRIEFSGMFFRGQNIANLGALRQGFTIIGTGNVIPVHSTGGWAQLTFLATPRLSFNIYGGQHDDRNSDLLFGGIAKNQAYAANAMYRLSSNVIVSLEGSQVRT
ncbi:MAG: hypothetical protein ACRD7E_19280, partial [Bryobacteraceae bacterium]